MLDRKWLFTHVEDYEKILAARQTSGNDFGKLAELETQRKTLIHQLETLRHQRKQASDDIGKRKRAGEDTATAQTTVRQLGEQIAMHETNLATLEQTLEQLLSYLPNVPLPEVPVGASADDNQVVRNYEPRRNTPAFNGVQAHWDIGERLGILDFERASKISGARFAFLRGLGARLELELASWMTALHAAAGYEEVLPPYLVRPETLEGTGQLPKFAEDLFHIEKQNLYLIPTAEVPVTNLFSGEILPAETLPKKFVGFSPCFRAEAGAAGKDTRGMIRVHQFHKVELVQFERPDNSRGALEQLTNQAEQVLKLLDLPYRVLRLCTGDMGFSSAMTYDLEVWLPGQGRWLEVSSCSTFTDFQARRANIRYRPTPDAKPEFVHTLNGSALALGRTIVAILENYQNADGSVTVPEVLRDRLKTDKIVRS